jgi:hypothetical protein
MSDAAYQTVVQYSWDDATDLFEAALTQAIEQDQGENSAPQSANPPPGLPISVL